jgi:hypothetical protein
MQFYGEAAHLRGFCWIINKIHLIYPQRLRQNQERKLLITEFIPLLHKRLITTPFWKNLMLIEDIHFIGFFWDIDILEEVKHFLDRKYSWNEDKVRFSKGFVRLLIKRLVEKNYSFFCRET